MPLINRNITSMTLKSYILDGVHYIEYTPYLKSFNLILLSSEIITSWMSSDYGVKLEKFSVNFELEDHYFYSESNTMYASDFHQLMEFVTQFSSSLIYLSLNFFPVNFREIDLKYFEASEFRKKWIESMTQLEKVLFYAKLPDYSSDFIENKRFF